jgi:hypothetical protein
MADEERTIEALDLDRRKDLVREPRPAKWLGREARARGLRA